MLHLSILVLTYPESAFIFHWSWTCLFSLLSKLCIPLPVVVSVLKLEVLFTNSQLIPNDKCSLFFQCLKCTVPKECIFFYQLLNKDMMCIAVRSEYDIGNSLTCSKQTTERSNRLQSPASNFHHPDYQPCKSSQFSDIL